MGIQAMIEEREDNKQFRMRLEDPSEMVEERVIPAEINELKLEKISQRVTLISVLIPVLIVIVLVITYLDIKKRVTQTEDTGNIEFQKLSGDLESRFSSLSVRQARIEDAMQKLSAETDQANAALQIRLQKLDDLIKKATGNTVTQKDFETTKAEIVKQINEVVNSSNEASQQVATIAQKIKDQMEQLTQSMEAINTKMSEVDRQMARLEENKIDKPTMDLSLRLEALRIQNELKAQIEALQAQINSMGIRTPPSTSKQIPPTTAPSTSAPTSSTQPPIPEQPKSTYSISGKPTKPSGTTSTKIEEQNINK